MKPYLSSVGIVFLVTLAILAWPRQAHAVQLAQVYNYAAGTYSGAQANISTPPHAPTTQVATTKSVVQGPDWSYGYPTYSLQIGWKYYPGYSSPVAFYETQDQYYNPQHVYIQNVSWGSTHRYHIWYNDAHPGWNQYDFYFDGAKKGTNFGPVGWQNLVWYAGARMSSSQDMMYSRVGLSPNRFSLFVYSTSSWTPNRMNYQRISGTSFWPIFFIDNYCDFIVYTWNWQ